MWKKDLIDKIGQFNESVSCHCEDYDYEIRTFLQTDKIKHVNKSLVKINQDEETLSHKNYSQMKEKHGLVRDFYNHFLNNDNPIICHSKTSIDNVFYLPPEYRDLVSTNKKAILYTKEELESKLSKKISIVMAYHNRKNQTIRTLQGFEQQYANKYNFEVIIVDDNSQEEKLSDISSNFSFPIKYVYINQEEKGNNINPCVVYNRGFELAEGEIIILQNPECYHVGNILQHTLLHMNESQYFTYSCYTANSFELTDELLSSQNIVEKIDDQSFNARNLKAFDILWYNHPEHNKTDFHFCSAIYKDKLDLLGGFDSRFHDGYCYDDAELLSSIKYILKLDIVTISSKNVFVIHQFHKRNTAVNIQLEKDDHPVKRKWLQNQNLYKEIIDIHTKSNFQYPKLLHLYWDGSPLSYLNYLTILSFNKYHRGWKINVYLPHSRTKEISWKSHEQKLRYEGTCYLNRLKDIHNVNLHYVHLDKIGFRNDASEVIKSDYFRYYILQKHGGIWSDFDIIFTGNVEEKMNFTEESIIFKCLSKTINGNYYYYPIGFFIAQPNNKFFKYLMEKARENFDPNEYQSIGAVMLSNLFPDSRLIFEKDLGTVKICDHEFYLPWAWNQLDEFLVKKDNILPKNNIGIHWFNGATQSKEYAIKLDERMLKNKFSIECYLDRFVSEYYQLPYNVASECHNSDEQQNHKSVSIVMAHKNKKKQLEETLRKINMTKYDHDKMEIIIVDNNSHTEEKLYLSELSQLVFDIEIVLLKLDDSNIYNPCVAYNLGLSKAKGDIIIIQNPEVMHVGDCIQYVMNNLQESDWLSFNCYGLGSYEENSKIKNMNEKEIYNFIWEKHKIKQEQNNIIGKFNYFDGDVSGWLNHYSLHFVAYHYCAAIHKKDLVEKMGGGFFPDYGDGICFDDNDFVNYLVYNAFNLKINKFKSGSPFVIHQYHDKTTNLSEEIVKELWNKNKQVFIKRCDQIGFPHEVDIAIRDDKFNPHPTMIK
jgi:GT2 family glycosyltransferase